jgi:hypothetical protein
MAEPRTITIVLVHGMVLPAPPNVKPSPAAKPQQQVTRVAARSILMLA